MKKKIKTFSLIKMIHDINATWKWNRNEYRGSYKQQIMA